MVFAGCAAETNALLMTVPAPRNRRCGDVWVRPIRKNYCVDLSPMKTSKVHPQSTPDALAGRGESCFTRHEQRCDQYGDCAGRCRPAAFPRLYLPLRAK